MPLLQIKQILSAQRVFTLLTLLGLTMNWQCVLARECQKDEYYDLHTGNCDPCAPVCSVMNCSQFCPDFKMPDSPSDGAAVSSSGGSLATEDLLAVILVPLSVLVLAFFTFLVRKKCYKKMKEWYLLKRTKLSIQESKIDNDPEAVSLNKGTEI